MRGHAGAPRRTGRVTPPPDLPPSRGEERKRRRGPLRPTTTMPESPVRTVLAPPPFRGEERNREGARTVPTPDQEANRRRLPSSPLVFSPPPFRGEVGRGVSAGARAVSGGSSPRPPFQGGEERTGRRGRPFVRWRGPRVGGPLPGERGGRRRPKTTFADKRGPCIVEGSFAAEEAMREDRGGKAGMDAGGPVPGRGRAIRRGRIAAARCDG